MTEERGRAIDFNNGGNGSGAARININSKRNSDSRGGNNNLRHGRRDDNGGGGGRSGTNDQRQGETNRSYRNNAPPRLSIPEIKKSQEETTTVNFSSSELSFKGSDRIVFITDGEYITTVWKKILKRESPWNRDDVKIFISSALVVTDSQTGYKVEELVKELGNPESGLKKLREIIDFPMSCDAGLKKGVLSFQYVILPLLGLLTRTAITECILEKYIHAIFTTLYTNLDSFLYNNVMKMLDKLVQRNSVVDREVRIETLLTRERYSFIPSSLGVFFLVIVRLLTELLRRIKEASTNETMHKIYHDLRQLKTTYQHSIEQQQSPSTSTDPLINNLETRRYFFIILEKEMKIMNKMLNNGRNLIFEQNSYAKDLKSQSYYRELARKVDFARTYDPPGELSKHGKRHDNDHVNISDILIIPTREEVLCDRKPFLPSSLPGVLHFLPDGVSKLLDTQFRLLREDMLNTIRGGISNLLTALLQDNSTSPININLSKELEKVQNGGGRFKYNNGMSDNGDLQVYANVHFVEIGCDRRKGFFCTIGFTPPRIRSAKSVEGRKEYWKKCKRLLVGSLVTLLLPNSNPNQNLNSNSNPSSNSGSNSNLYSLYFGVVMSRDEDKLAEYENVAEININIINPSFYIVALNEISNSDKVTNRSLVNRFMVESTGVYLESYYHILKSLQTIEPSSLPFDQYLAPSIDDLNKNEDEKGKSSEQVYDSVDGKVENPLYTRAPGFKFDLSALCKDKNQSLTLNVADVYTHDKVAKDITDYSKLDETQAKALISALTREIALIEGPPGTGKTVVGIEIMRVLLARENRRTKIGPILTICFTNHALDQFLEHLLDEKITKKIVRLGSRTKSPKIENFMLEKICRNHPNTSSLTRLLEDIEKEVNEIKGLFNKRLTWNDIENYLNNKEKKFFKKFDCVTYNDLPYWVLENNRNKKLSVFEKWIKGIDITIIKNMKKNFQNYDKNGKRESNKSNINSYNSFEVLPVAVDEEYEDTEMDSNDESQIDYETIQWIENYDEPKTDRPLDVLLGDYSIWKMSRVERLKLHDYWRTEFYEEKLNYLQKRHEEIRHEIDNLYDEGRRQILLRSDVIGMTTNGAAKFQALIKSISPKIIICEEAGEVLEAHIISALTPLTQHLILIGDHNQLRPHVATYSLSMDSPVGKNYQLDKSLFERLVDSNNAVKIEKTQLLTQRRMRKDISDLIRYTLYPDLIDGKNIEGYSNIRGAQHNVYFIDHRHPEDSSGGELAMQSHVNRYEVKMVVEMVNYFVKNGYNKSDDIAVLTPYLGQMIKIKEALSKKFVVIIDERDAQDIAEIEELEDEENNNDEHKGNFNRKTSVTSKPSTQPKSLNQQVTLRTVDNFQGEEASIVIISLVRNFSKSGELGEHDTIGFLKSTNRSNVLLSRAREGMYLIGNSELMSLKSKNMWAPVIDILHKRNPPQIGFGMPIVCNRHPDYKNTIIEPGQFEQVSPEGGCHKLCDISLPCGHVCTRKCHSDDPKHIGVKCLKPCTKLHLGCNHPCRKRCFEDCGRCEFPIGDIILPDCGHTFQNTKCWQNKVKDTLKCNVLVDIILPECGHTLHNAKCWQNKVKETLKCNVLIDIILPGCGHTFHNAKCWQNKVKETLKCNVLVDILLPGCGHTFHNAKCWQNKVKETLRCNFPINITLPHCGHILENVECWKNKAGDIPHCNMLIDVALSCGHILQNILCWKNQIKELPNCIVLIDIVLPGCGHTMQNVECWKDQNKETLKCMTLVTRNLSRCEHTKVIHCFESVNDVKCKEKCGKQLTCGHECSDKCFECQKRSSPRESKNKKTAALLIERTQHGKCTNKCNKLLFCGHKCSLYCHEGSECLPCKNKCVMSCEHITCNKSCLEPCAICAEKCLWECEHQGKCELSCGTPCFRLPCNERCRKTLECGHKCAGVCGEICPSKDFCIDCASIKVKNQLSDIIIGATFSEVDWNNERMIVLSCGHVYTMKSMDMLMKMQDYYNGSIEGGWTSVKMLPTLPINIKTCPECQTPVKDVRRYGRIIKKCTLDTSNKKFLLKYDRKLKEISKKTISFVFGDKMKKMRDQLRNDLPKYESRSKEIVFKEQKITIKNLPELTPYYYFENIEVYHGFDEGSEQVWINHIKELLNHYRELTLIIRATKIPFYAKAFETTVTNLYPNDDSEKKLISESSNLHTLSSSSLSFVPSESSQLSFQEKLALIGVSIPQVNHRIYLDAFIEIINIQKVLYHEILFIIEELSSELTPVLAEDIISIKEVWKIFAERLQISIHDHLRTIKEVAESTRYGRHLLLINVEILEFDLKILTYQLRYSQNGIFGDNSLQTGIIEKCEVIKENVAEISKSCGFSNTGEEFKLTIRERLENLREICNKVVICAENFDSSIEETLEIHQSVKTDFKISEHWYKWYECPNGHLYIIEECDKVMHCPDCNVKEID